MLFKKETVSPEDTKLQEVLATLKHYGDFHFDLDNFQEYDPTEYVQIIPFSFEKKAEHSKDRETILSLYLENCKEAHEFAASVMELGLEVKEISAKVVDKMNSGAKYFFQSLVVIAEKTGVKYQQLALLVIHNVFADTLNDEWPKQQGVDVETLKIKLLDLIQEMNPEIRVSKRITIVQLLIILLTLQSHHKDATRKTYSQESIEMQKSKIDTLLRSSGSTTFGTTKIRVSRVERYIYITTTLISTTMTIGSLAVQLSAEGYSFWSPVIFFWIIALLNILKASEAQGLMVSAKKHEIAHVLHQLNPEKYGLILQEFEPNTQPLLKNQIHGSELGEQ